MSKHPYPFRSRREIHSGEPKVYSDVPRDQQELVDDPQSTPARGTRARAASSGPVTQPATAARATNSPISAPQPETFATVRRTVSAARREGGAQSTPTPAVRSDISATVRRTASTPEAPAVTRPRESTTQAEVTATVRRTVGAAQREAAPASRDIPTLNSDISATVRRVTVTSEQPAVTARHEAIPQTEVTATVRRTVSAPDSERAPASWTPAPKARASATTTTPTPVPAATSPRTPQPAHPQVSRRRHQQLPTTTEVLGGSSLNAGQQDTDEDHSSTSAKEPRPDEPTDRSEQAPSQEDDAPAETTGMRSRRLASERRVARQRQRRRRLRSFFVILLVLGLVGGAGYLAYSQLVNVSNTASDDYSGPGSDTVQITIAQDSSGRDMGQALVDAGVVKSVGAFVRQFETNRAALSIRPGTYRLKRQMSAAAALAALLDETNRVDSTITVSSGQKVSEVKQRFVDIMGLTDADVDAAFADTTAIGLPSEAGGNAEGWLLPGSYEVREDDTPTSVIARMVKGTIDELDRLGVAPAQRETVLTKASIVDGEMNIDKYMPMVARVIENRLADTEGETRGMLGMDSTVLYGVGKTSGVPNQDDLDNDNPYNTRLHAGLPPTPIGQPSEKAIKAVLKPAEGNWLYFVTVNLDTGETLFASTLEEQEKNREKFQDYCNAHPTVCSAS